VMKAGQYAYRDRRARKRVFRALWIARINAAARANGTRFLREAAIDLVRSGQTTLQEINRVTFVA